MGLALAMAFVFGSSAADAQQGLAPSDTHRGLMGSGMMGMMDSAAVEGRLAEVKVRLGITDAQASEWKAYAKVVRARADAMWAMHDSMRQAMQSGPASARLDAHVMAMDAMTEGLERLGPATAALYKI